MVWPCEKGKRGISGRNGNIVEKESRKTKDNLERYSEERFGTNRCGWSVALDRGRWRKIIASLTPT